MLFLLKLEFGKPPKPRLCRTVDINLLDSHILMNANEKRLMLRSQKGIPKVCLDLENASISSRGSSNTEKKCYGN